MKSKNTVRRIERRLGIGKAPAKKPSGKPVSPRTFVESSKYLDAKGQLYPKILDEFIELNSGSYEEAVLTGGIGSGKTTIAVYTIAYQLYLLSLPKNPHKKFGLDRSSDIVLVFQSVTAELAKRVDYDRFKELIDHAPYFQKYFRYNRSVESELRFPNRIIVRPVSGKPSAALGQNVIAGVIDEVNYMATVGRSKLTPEGGDYDQATVLYRTIARRRASRFMKKGQLPGILCLVSSRRYPGQFTDLKEKERNNQLLEKGETSIYLFDKRVWEVKPKGTYSGEIFHVFTGDETRNARILEPRESVQEADRGLVIEVPVEHRDEFEADLPDALRELAGVALLASRPFFTDRGAVAACFDTHDSILSHESADFSEGRLCFMTKNIHQPKLFRWVHLDLSHSRDATGIVIGYIKGFERISRGDTTEILPHIRIDCALQLRPPKGGEIQYEHIRTLIYGARDLGLAVKYVTADSYQSADTLQIMRQKKFVTGRQSIDKDMRPYQTLKAAIYDGRLDIPRNDVLLRELVTLDLDTKTGIIDHLPRGSKDVADALAGVVYGLTRRVAPWKQHGFHPKIDAPNFTQFTKDFAPDNLRDSGPHEMRF